MATWVWMMWIWACVGLAVGKPMAGQLYSSQSLMDDLFVFDKLVGDVLPLLPEHIPAASRYQESYWSMAQDRAMVGGHVTAVEVTGNPLHVYWVIKRLVLYWPALNISLQHYHTQAAYALARLQRYYRIPIGNFMQGRLDNTYSSVRLTPEDCITIANATHYFGEMSDAWLWYKSMLSRSTVVGSNRYMEIRVSQTGWLNNASHPSLLSIARRISYITGLHVFEGPPEHMAGEYLQVLNYGIGGHYVMHSDLFYKKFPEGRLQTSGFENTLTFSGEHVAPTQRSDNRDTRRSTSSNTHTSVFMKIRNAGLFHLLINPLGAQLELKPMYVIK
ncbi:Prolyl 4-hydroxylase subunit alpha-3-like [Homarus americanus]|uniref:Prolyl 4-hydroxylase subunit alpha-3-like n=1 Tax=Homarus americanus TaxID=6706 RepID=A0A8J5KBS2_HOMAM|nr:Prolyl 4-hydroxylase subunit alpha-3-like [Homarus americanus]